MNFSADVLPWPIFAAAWGILAVFLLRSAPAVFRQLKKPDQARIAAGATAAVFLLWCLHANTHNANPNTSEVFHLMGISLVSLMLGPRVAVWIIALCCCAYALLFLNGHDVLAAAFSTLAMAVPAVAVFYAVQYGVRRKLPPHLFVFILVRGFFGSTLGMLVTGVVQTAIWHFSGLVDADILWKSSLTVFWMLSWGEGFLTGLLCAIFVAFAPQLLAASYRDGDYLHTPQW